MPQEPTIDHLLQRHHGTLEAATDAIRRRVFWSPYPESPSRSLYGESATADGLAAFTAHLGTDFALPGLDAESWVDGEASVFGTELGLRYPRVRPGHAVASGMHAMPQWRDAGPDARAGVCLEILHRLNRRSFELAYAGMHTTGQPFVMAFQATGPHAQDRALEAVAHAHSLMAGHHARVVWDKRTARGQLRVAKEFHVVPRGAAAVIACRTFPTWNSYPGLFASLVTGNPVVVKPHPSAVLPLAITVAVAREVLIEEGFSPELLSLVVDDPDSRHAATLAQDPAVRIIDYTGSATFGSWLEENARQARVYAEKSGVNCVVIDSTSDFRGMCRNLAHSLALFSGQMCTAPQVIFVPERGVSTDEGELSCEEVGAGIVAAIDDLVDEPHRAENVLAVITDSQVLGRLQVAGELGEVLRESRAVPHPDFPGVELRSPAVLTTTVDNVAQYGREHFGPIAFVVSTADTPESLRVTNELALHQGALTTSLYSTSDAVADAARTVALDTGTTLSVNLTGPLLVNQSAAFSDFHGTGNNPAANATLVDPAFVADRFSTVEIRQPVPIAHGDATDG